MNENHAFDIRSSPGARIFRIWTQMQENSIGSMFPNVSNAGKCPNTGEVAVGMSASST